MLKTGTPSPSPKEILSNRVRLLKEASQQLASRDDEIREHIQHFDEMIASTDCRVQFWWTNHPLDVTHREGTYSPDGDISFPNVEIKEWSEIGWSKVGKEWRLSKRERLVARGYVDELGAAHTIDDLYTNHSALVDAPRMLKVEAVPQLEEFVGALTRYVMNLNESIPSPSVSDGGEDS